MRRLLFAMVAASAICLSPRASAMVVFDPSNFTQNTISAIKAVSAELQRAQQFLLQTQQYVAQLQNLAKLADPGAIIRDYAPEVDAAMKYVATLRTLYGDLKDLRDSVDRQFKEQAMSGLSWDQYVVREIVLAQRKLQTAQAAFGAVRGAMERIDSDYRQMREAQSKIHATQGMQGQMELTNQQLNQLVSLNREMLTSLSAMVQAMGEKLVSEAAGREAANTLEPVARQAAEAEWKRQQEAASRVQKRPGPLYR